VSSTNLPLTQGSPAAADPQSPLAESVDQGDPAGRESTASEVADTGPDEVAEAAVELAREAAESVAEPGTVGEHLAVTRDEGGLTMHSFRCSARGYRGWRWAVTLAHLPGSDRVTVCDTVLLPGADAVLAPAWIPWSDRLAPGDIGAGDDLPYRPNDPLLVPGYTVTDEQDADEVLFWELGLGRERVLGPEGLSAAAQRWEQGRHGPASELAIQASAACVSCAYLLPVAGTLRGHFGVCANEWSPADGTVVTYDFGCGAHSETDLELPAPEPLPPHILDDMIIERVSVERDEDSGDATDADATDVEASDVEAEGDAEASDVVEAEGDAEASDAEAEDDAEAPDAVATDVDAVAVAVAVADVDDADADDVEASDVEASDVVAGPEVLEPEAHESDVAEPQAEESDETRSHETSGDEVRSDETPSGETRSGSAPAGAEITLSSAGEAPTES
jgi:hypothetical protein